MVTSYLNIKLYRIVEHAQGYHFVFKFDDNLFVSLAICEHPHFGADCSMTANCDNTQHDAVLGCNSLSCNESYEGPGCQSKSRQVIDFQIIKITGRTRFHVNGLIFLRL